MKKLLTALAVSAVVLMVGSYAHAISFTVTNITGDWSNTVGGTNVNYPADVAVGYGNQAQDQVRWGTDVGNGQSGLGFTGNAGGVAGNLSVPVNTTFEIGQLVHFNRPIAVGTNSTASDLTLTMAFVEIPNQVFTFTFAIDETLNQAPCAYPGSTTCPDRITFPSSLPSQTFSYLGNLYTLQLVGFANALGGDPVTDFISEEGTDNDTLLFGRITEVVIPEPTTMLLLGSGLLGLAGAGFRKKKA